MIKTTIAHNHGLPHRVIVIYKNNHSITHASWHEVVNGVILEGKPLSETTLKRALESLNKNSKGLDKKILPGNVLYHSPEEMIFFTPAMVKPHLYKGGGQLRPNPPLLWQVKSKQLRLFALGSDQRPSEDSKIYHAPYFNTTPQGVCTGDVKLPQEVSPHNQEAYIEGFFHSVFTHPSGHKNYNYPGSFSEMWEEASRLGYFPVEYLLEYGSLKSIL